jgi:S-DNA-T family DNA segregation ATPase FtsK/SpoIIIE
MVAIFFISFSLVSYHPHDISFLHVQSHSGSVQNWCGALGAHLAAALWYLFGSASFLLIPLLIWIAFFVAQQRKLEREWERFLAGGIMICVVAVLCALHGIDFVRSPVPGGYIGFVISKISIKFFDYVGSFVMMYALFEVCAIIMIRFSCMQTIIAFVRITRTGYKKFLKSQRLKKMSVASYAIARNMCLALRDGMQSIVDGTFCEGTSFAMPDDSLCACTTMHDQDEIFFNGVNMHHDISIMEQNVLEVPTQQDVSATELTGDRKQQQSYALPNLDIFIAQDTERHDNALKRELEQRAKTLEEKLARFGVKGSVTSIKRGPVVTLFEYQPHIDTKLSKIIALEDDLALALQALSIRILAPIPGRSVVGFEVANTTRKDVLFSQLVKSSEYKNFSGVLPLILGEDTMGNNVIVDLAKMPHLLVAGSTGSGKSASLNSMLVSLLCACLPQDVKLILIDPKRLEFAPFADIPHLLFPIVTDPKRAVPILRWVVQQMEKRYEMMSKSNARNIEDFNALASNGQHEKLPYIVVVIDELSDLMMTAGRDIEDLITRITQMARAAGIHVIIATQRPSVDVITGLIKVNFPSRISFRVTSKIDSRTILDCGGADKLLGRGDMLFLDSHSAQLRRIHGAYVSLKEIENVIAHIKSQQSPQYLDLHEELSALPESLGADDEMYKQVITFLDEVDEVSISLLQRRFRIGYNRSARIIEMLESHGLILPSQNGKTRKVIK